jgi:HEAT repeat protein
VTNFTGGLVIVGQIVLGATVTAAHVVQAPASDLDRAKVTALERLGREQDPSVDDVRAMLTDGLSDSNPVVRRAALRVLSMRLGDPMVTRTEERYRLEKQKLSSLDTVVVARLGDQDKQVRREAVEAVSALETSLHEVASPRVIHRRMGRALMDRYRSEEDALVRTRIINVFAWFEPEDGFSGEVRSLIRKALKDPADGPRQVALQAVSRGRLSALLPDVAACLSPSTPPSLRGTAAATLGSFGPQASPYLSRIQDALAIEVDDTARTNMLSAIAQITR